jgi:recombination protein RecA
MFGSPETTTGGRALKFYASVRLDIRKTGLIKRGDVVVGAETKISVKKNKLAAPFTEALVHIIYGEGVSREHDILMIGEELGILSRSGSWYNWGTERIGQGSETARIFLKENSDVRNKIENEIREKLFVPQI